MEAAETAPFSLLVSHGGEGGICLASSCVTGSEGIPEGVAEKLGP